MAKLINDFEGKQAIRKPKEIEFDPNQGILKRSYFKNGATLEDNISATPILIDLSTFKRGWRAFVPVVGAVFELGPVEAPAAQPRVPAGKSKAGDPIKWNAYSQINVIATDEKVPAVLIITDAITFGVFVDVYNIVGPFKVLGVFKEAVDVDGGRKPVFEFFDRDKNKIEVI